MGGSSAKRASSHTAIKMLKIKNVRRQRKPWHDVSPLGMPKSCCDQRNRAYTQNSKRSTLECYECWDTGRDILFAAVGTRVVYQHVGSHAAGAAVSLWWFIRISRATHDTVLSTVAARITPRRSTAPAARSRTSIMHRVIMGVRLSMDHTRSE